MSFASIDGVVTPTERAMIPVSDQGLLRGDGAFEVICLYDSIPFALEDHLQRLVRTCEGLRLPLDLTALRSETDELLSIAQPGNALLRLVITRGERRIAMIEPLPTPLDQIRVKTVTYSPNGILDGLKTLSYAANMLAIRSAHEQGFDEALFVSSDGTVLEGPTWSFFWVENQQLFTPPLGAKILRSVTRERILEEMEVTEAPCSLSQLENAEEAFVASTAREVTPISVIDQLTLPSSPGPLTRAAQLKLRRRIEDELSAVAAAV